MERTEMLDATGKVGVMGFGMGGLTYLPTFQ
jgi:hypothetical protein